MFSIYTNTVSQYKEQNTDTFLNNSYLSYSSFGLLLYNLWFYLLELFRENMNMFPNPTPLFITHSSDFSLAWGYFALIYTEISPCFFSFSPFLPQTVPFSPASTATESKCSFHLGRGGGELCLNHSLPRSPPDW